MRPPSSRPLPVLLAWIALAAAPARGVETAAILINATDQAWLIRTADFRLPAPRAGMGMVREISLEPLSELRLVHERAAGATVRMWFEIVSVPEPGAAEPPVEGYLYFRTERSWLGLGPERTRLSGAFYADGHPVRYRWTEVADAVLWVEPV